MPTDEDLGRGLAAALLSTGRDLQRQPWTVQDSAFPPREMIEQGWAIGADPLPKRSLGYLGDENALPWWAAPIAAGLGLRGLRSGPVPRPAFSLSPNTTASDPGRFSYNILRDGRVVGDVRGVIRDGQAQIYGISGLAPNSFGPAAMRQLLSAFRRDFPDVEKIGGQRGGGARPFGSQQDIDLP